jgi:CBS domain-containing protein
VRPFADAIAFGIEGWARAIEELLERLRSGETRSATFVAPSATGWLLPLHELALMTARDLARNDVERVELRLLSPEDRRLAFFGGQGSESTAHLLAAAGIEFIASSGMTRRPGPADYPVTLPLPRGPEPAGVPTTGPNDLLQVDEHGAREDLADVYASGDAVDFPVKQGGLAARQAHTAAEQIAAGYGACLDRAPFRPVLRGMLFTATSRCTCAPTCPVPTPTFPVPGISGGLRRRSRAAPSRRNCSNGTTGRDSAGRPQGSSTSTSRFLRARRQADCDGDRNQARRPTMSEGSVVPSHGSYLLPHFEHATVADAMHPGILSCDADATLTEVARIMSAHHVHCIVVKGTPEDESDESPVWGIISDLDMLRAGIRPDGPETASAIARRPVIRLQTTAPLRDAAELMLTEGTSHIVAVNPGTGHPIGILSTLDIAGVLAWGEM